jgi:uncharacterized protein (TIGR02265 family)
MPASDEKLVFQQTIEGLFVRALATQMTPALKGLLRNEGLNLDAALDPGYPSHKFTGWVQLTAKHLFPHMPQSEGVRELGKLFFKGYVGTFIGQAMFKMMKIIGAKRTLQRMERNFRTGNNFISVRFEDCGPRHVKLHFADVNGMPTFYQGVILEGSASVAQGTQVLVELQPNDSVTYNITWTA